MESFQQGSYATICRLCMQRDGFMLGIFNHFRGKERSIYRKIMDCTELQVIGARFFDRRLALDGRFCRHFVGESIGPVLYVFLPIRRPVERLRGDPHRPIYTCFN